MKKVISARDIEEMLRSGKDLRSLPEDALWTPSARDLLRDVSSSRAAGVAAADVRRRTASGSVPVRAVTSRSPKAEIESLFSSPAIHEL